MTTTPRTILRPCESPGTASAEEGVVLLDGPDGVAVAMTAEAAMRTAESLLAAAARALGQAPFTSDFAGADRGRLDRTLTKRTMSDRTGWSTK